MRHLAPITFTRHGEGRLERAGITEAQAIRDMKRHLWAARKERGGSKIKITGDLQEYILSDKLEVITVLEKTRRRKKKKNRLRSIYLNEQWLNMDKASMQALITKLTK